MVGEDRAGEAAMDGAAAVAQGTMSADRGGAPARASWSWASMTSHIHMARRSGPRVMSVTLDASREGSSPGWQLKDTHEY